MRYFRYNEQGPDELTPHIVVEPFLTWLYERYNVAVEAGDRWWWETLPDHVDLPDAPFAMHGYRRGGQP